MPKDEFDFEDPFELNGVALLTEEDTTDAMCECFIEEFLRLGYNSKQVLALFRNPNYLGMNMVLRNRGEPFVRDQIAEIFARWGRVVIWPEPCGSRREEAQTQRVEVTSQGQEECQSPLTSAATTECDPRFTDPMGAAIPKLSL
jgi:hypothetical protein